MFIQVGTITFLRSELGVDLGDLMFMKVYLGSYHDFELQLDIHLGDVRNTYTVCLDPFHFPMSDLVYLSLGSLFLLLLLLLCSVFLLVSSQLFLLLAVPRWSWFWAGSVLFSTKKK